MKIRKKLSERTKNIASYVAALDSACTLGSCLETLSKIETTDDLKDFKTALSELLERYNAWSVECAKKLNKVDQEEAIEFGAVNAFSKVFFTHIQEDDERDEN